MTTPTNPDPVTYIELNSPSAEYTRPRILFVDDDPGVLSAVSRFLRRHKIEVRTALDAEAGLREVKEKGPFHLVVSDYRMPGMTGGDFLAKVAEIAPGTRRMILSAFADSQQLLTAINAGKVHRYLVKPWDSRELLNVVRELVAEYARKSGNDFEVRNLVDENRQLEQALEQNMWRLEAQGRSLHESNRRLHLLSAHIEKVRDEERRSIARDIHDDLGQTLTAMNLELAAMLRLPEGTDMRARLSCLKSQMDVAIGTVQRVVSCMRPPLLEELGLEEALDALAAKIRQRGEMRCIFSCNLDGAPLPYDIIACLYRITQESVTNILRHSKATKVLIILRRRDGWCLLQIWDNGVGITEQQAAASTSYGIMGMRERVAGFGGSFSISPRAGGGTVVEAHLPEKYEEAPGEADSYSR